MLRKIILFVSIILVCECLQSPAVKAQDSCQKISTWWFGDPIPPGWYALGNSYPGTFVFLIASFASAYRDPKTGIMYTCGIFHKHLCTSGDCSSQGGSPIDLDSGNTFIRETDVALPGLGGGITLQRTWNSIFDGVLGGNSSVGIFGPNWKSTYEEQIFMDTDNFLKYARGDGSYWAFGVNPTNGLVVISPGNISASLAQTATNWVLRFQNGEQRQFDLNTGMLTAIVDRNGNTTQLTYDSSGRLTTIADPAGRHLYFNYGSGGTTNLVTSVTSDFGISLSYTYDTSNRLSQVTRPDLTTITFAYDTQSLITQVTDSNGKVLESHTYDSIGRGLTSSQANGVNSLSVTYP